MGYRWFSVWIVGTLSVCGTCGVLGVNWVIWNGEERISVGVWVILIDDEGILSDDNWIQRDVGVICVNNVVVLSDD